MAQGGLPDVGDLDLHLLLGTLKEQPQQQAPYQQQQPQAPHQQQQQQQFQQFLLFQQYQQTMGFQQQPSFHYEVQVTLPSDLPVLQDLATSYLSASSAPLALPDPPASLQMAPSSTLPPPATTTEEAPGEFWSIVYTLSSVSHVF